MNIQNKSVLITGANRGIGRALVNEALRRGAARVYAGTRGALEIADERVIPLALDVTNTSQIQHASDQVGELDLLINNAGIAIYDDLSNLEVIEQHMAVNFFGLLKVTQAFLPLLRRSKGAIVNNSSLAALAALPGIGTYTAGAIAELQKGKAPNPGAWYQGYLGYAYAISGDRAKAEEALRELEELAKRQYVSPTAFATIYLGLGQKEKCLDWLEKSYEQQDSACWYLKIDQIYDSVRNEPRFQALVEKIFHETQ